MARQKSIASLIRKYATSDEIFERAANTIIRRDAELQFDSEYDGHGLIDLM